MGSDAVLSIRRVTAIPPEKSGKYRYVVSHVAPGGAESIPGMDRGAS
jgi:hypothetical protein